MKRYSPALRDRDDTQRHLDKTSKGLTWGSRDPLIKKRKEKEKEKAEGGHVRKTCPGTAMVVPARQRALDIAAPRPLLELIPDCKRVDCSCRFPGLHS